MCCVRPNEDYMREVMEKRQQQVVDDLEKAINNADLPEVKGIAAEGKKNDGVPGVRNTRTNG